MAVWSLIYLPGLGTLEIKGEEGRRILPSVRMLQTGNYIVPYVGSDPYFTKPPLINWLVAAAFRLTGQADEWSARLPSVLAVLAVALAFLFLARRALGPPGALAAALIWLTNFGVVEKGRLIEIEALYASLAGLAFISWLSWWEERRSAWLTWTVPWIFLGLGLLAKGPLHLLYFYAIVAAVLWRAGEWRKLWQPPHCAGVLIMLALFAAWAVPCLEMMPAAEVAHTWSRQFSGRLSGEDFHLAGWLMNIPRGLGYFLPWTIFLPFVRRQTSEETDARALRWAIALSFLGVCLLPGALARYTMPLLAPACWLLARQFTAGASIFPRWLRLPSPPALPFALRWPVWISLLVACAIILYAFALMPRLRGREKVRNIARQINAALPPREPLYAVDPDYQPSLFYVRAPIVYLARLAEVPPDARAVLVQERDAAKALAPERWQPRALHRVLRLQDYRKKTVVLLELAPADGGR